MRTSLLVIGGGAAGLMAAGTSSHMNAETLVLERNERPARKLMITGKGRCNVTNNCPALQELISNVPRNGRFLYGAFSRFMPADVIDFFDKGDHIAACAAAKAVEALSVLIHHKGRCFFAVKRTKPLVNRACPF